MLHSCLYSCNLFILKFCFRLTVLVIILESRHLSEYPAHDEEDDVHEKHPVLKAYFCLNVPLAQQKSTRIPVLQTVVYAGEKLYLP